MTLAMFVVNNGTVTTLGYISFFSSCLFMLKTLLQCLYMLYMTICLKRILGFRAASVIAASMEEESSLLEEMELLGEVYHQPLNDRACSYQHHTGGS